MLLLDDLRFAQNSKTASREHRPRIAGAKRLERAQILRQPKPYRSRSNLSIDREHRLKICFSQARRRMFIQASAEFRDMFAPDRQPSCVRVPTELIKQVAANRQAVKKMIGLDAARRTVAHVAIKRDHHAWSIQALRDL